MTFFHSIGFNLYKIFQYTSKKKYINKIIKSVKNKVQLLLIKHFTRVFYYLYKEIEHPIDQYGLSRANDIVNYIRSSVIWQKF